MNESIFPRKNQDIINLFESAKHPKKVACVVLDYAKRTHTALICNGNGKRLKAAFPVENNTEGLEYILTRVDKICKKHHISHNNVFFGGESCGTYALNFIHAIEQKGFLVISVDPKEAKDQRASFQASTDKIDLLGIAKVLLDQHGSSRAVSSESERQLRNVTRHRSCLVRSKTAARNRMHCIVDQLFPNFLDETKSGIPAFSETSLWLMEERFSSRQIRSRKLQTTIRQARKHGLKKPEECVRKLQEHACSVLQPVPDWIRTLQTTLHHEVQLYRKLLLCVEQADKEVALHLACTPAVMMTTIKGIGITLASGVGAEIGSPEKQLSVRRLTSYCGIVPRVKQTGGPEGESRYGKVSRRCNHILKNYVVQCGNHLGLHGPAELMEDHHRRDANGQHADFGMAKRFLRISMMLMRETQVYIPAALRERGDKDEISTYYLKLWEPLRRKWKKAGALEVAFDSKNPLGKWRDCIQEIYEIKLPL